MKHLTDEREPITVAEIDQAQADARAFMTASDDELERIDIEDLVMRLAAIVAYTYGPDTVPAEQRPRPEPIGPGPAAPWDV